MSTYYGGCKKRKIQCSALYYLLNNGIPSIEKSNTKFQSRSNHGAHVACYCEKKEHLQH